jgi:hypothetical protein
MSARSLRNPRVWLLGALVAGLLAVVGMAFRVSWNALRDIARAIGADPTAATVYPLVVDGLMALALVSTLVLVGRDRKFALWVLGGYTAASLVLNYVHGLVPALHGPGRVRLADWPPLHYALVLVASSLPVGSIYFGSDLVAKVLHHKPEPAEEPHSRANRSASDLPEPGNPLDDGSVWQSPPEEPTAPPAETAPEPAPVAAPVEPTEPTAPAVRVAARPRRATGTVPKSARSPRPTRTPEELLAEARSATADWSDDQLTADRIRVTVRTSAERARALRHLLKAERAEQGQRAPLHVVPATAPEPAPADEKPTGSAPAAPENEQTTEPEEKAS